MQQAHGFCLVCHIPPSKLFALCLYLQYPAHLVLILLVLAHSISNQLIKELQKCWYSKLLKKVTIMLKGNSAKMKGSLCNIPISEVFDTCKPLPRPADSSGLVIVKLKRKVEYRNHVLFEPSRPVFAEKFLNFLKSDKPLYSDIEINLDNVNLNFRNKNRSDLSTNNDSDFVFLELLRL